MSLANPGGGSGTTTRFRPAKYAMGLKSGQLAKDSSVYQVDFRRQGGKTVYDVTIPWSEIPGFAPAKGASYGCQPEAMPFEQTTQDPYVWGPKILACIQKHRLNWTAWSFHPWASPCVLADWDYTPTPYWGAFVRAALRGVPFKE